MATCRYCSAEIEWTESGGKWIPLNEGSFDRHLCLRTSRDPYRVLYLRPDAPPEVIRAAYRALANLYHPDKGGDGVRMAELNVAYEQIWSAE